MFVFAPVITRVLARAASSVVNRTRREDVAALARSGTAGTKAQRQAQRQRQAEAMRRAGVTRMTPAMKAQVSRRNQQMNLQDSKAAQADRLAKGNTRSSGSRDRADQRLAKDKAAQAGRMVTSNDVRERSMSHQAETKQAGDEARKKRLVNPEERRKEGEQKRADKEKKRLEKREQDKANQADRLVDGDERRAESEQHHQERLRKSEEKREQGFADQREASQRGIGQRDVRAEREWKEGGREAMQTAAAKTVTENAAQAVTPGGVVKTAFKAVAAANVAGLEYQLRNPRPMLRGRRAEGHAIALKGELGKAKEALNALQ